MKIYYIANIHLPNPKAHGIQFAKMCEAFVEAGADLELVVPFRRGLFKETFKNFYNLRQTIALKRLSVINIFSKTRFGFNLRALTFACSYFFYFLFKKIKGERAIIYTIDLDQFSFFLMPLLGWPYFFETHAKKRVDRIHRFFLRKVKGVIAINNLIKSAMLKNFSLKSEQVLVFPNGIDLKMFGSLEEVRAARQKLGIKDNIKVILYVGRFYDWKGLNILVGAANNLADNFVFYLVGGTAKQFQDITGLDKMPANIICVGEKDYKEMPLWMAAADALLLLGTRANEYSYEETSPMKLFEYMASGRPIVASRTPAIQDIVSDKEVVFYEPDNERDLVFELRNVLENPAAFLERAMRAKARVQEFTWEKRAAAIKEFIFSKL